MKYWTASCSLALALLLGLPQFGCSDFKKLGENLGLTDEKDEPEPETPPPKASTTNNDPYLMGSIGARTLLGSAEPVQLRGFGLVVGLGKNGSTDCPTVIRDYLIEFMDKNYKPHEPADYKRQFSAGELIDSPDTAVVEVTGVVPAGAIKGTRFDLRVQSVEGTSTRSLEGGLLLPCELRMFSAAVTQETLTASEVLAQAGGPVFVNPVPVQSGELRDGIDPLRGLVLGGGRSIEDRTTRLVLTEPSYPEARKIERRMNERFGQRPRTADAVSRSYVTLRTPNEFTRRPKRFLDLAPRVPLDDNPTFIDARVREMAQLLATPGSNYDQAAMALEAIGRRVIPTMQPLYTHSDARTRYYAARTGLRLGDASAVPVVAETATSGAPDRLRAIMELGETDAPGAAQKLVPMLNAAESDLRLAAYEGLLKHRHPAIRSTPFPFVLDQTQTNLVLDVVDCGGPPMIFVRQSRVPRIAIFGAKMPVATPIFYSPADDVVTLNAVKPGGDINLLCKYRSPKPEQLAVPPRTADLISALADVPRKDDTGRRRGAGLPYSDVVEVVAALCRDGSINAQFILERAGEIDLDQSDQQPPRPESDEPEAEPITPPGKEEPAQASNQRAE